MVWNIRLIPFVGLAFVWGMTGAMGSLSTHLDDGDTFMLAFGIVLGIVYYNFAVLMLKHRQHVETKDFLIQGPAISACSIGVRILLISCLNAFSFACVSLLNMTILTLMSICLSTAAWPTYCHCFESIGKDPFIPPEEGWGIFVLIPPLLMSFLVLAVVRLIYLMLL